MVGGGTRFFLILLGIAFVILLRQQEKNQGIAIPENR
jgi:hypothetical protein